MPQFAYLGVKATDYRVVLDRLVREVDRLEQVGSHPRVLAFMRQRLNDAQTQLQQLEGLIKVADPLLLPRAAPKLPQIERLIAPVATDYLPALLNESLAAAALGDLLGKAAQASGLAWIDDVVVRMDSPLAVLPLILETPLIFTPPGQVLSLLEVPGLFHELGHVVFEKFSTIIQALDQVRISHFTQLLGRVGAIAVAQRQVRQSEIIRARDYWSGAALSEVFCDVFGTLAGGPAHFISTVDLCLKYGRDPFVVNFDDEHPPAAARVYLAYEALGAKHKQHTSVQTAYTAWQAFESQHQTNQAFEYTAGRALLNAYLSAACSSLKAALPAFQAYTRPLWATGELGVDPTTLSFAELLNHAVQLMFERTGDYPAWETRALRALGIA